MILLLRLCGLTKIYGSDIFLNVFVAIQLVDVPAIDLAFTRTIIYSAADRTAFCETAVHLSIGMRTANAVTYAKLLHGSDFFVLCIQA
mmetsp:Transcript_11839/g.19362  ORF Transcript_11839/g.19362 Transcript_11839/m.19362 type:complete len:88 (+) Transcript_11839:110-373(+)